ncbi:unnamed protein product [Rodentolepis nana]|uniref:Uncharacterized protein n=1 Tax=Rodentolepis nana TaxID=102285 RepID=A0A0R3T408_RODNA|nr:unnamed protein product [Rodentolepis nana]
MLKFVVIAALILISQVPDAEADLAGYYLDFFGLRTTYIPYLNDDLEKIKEHREQKEKAREGLRQHFERENQRRRGEL